jgi:U3 small nucleolar RNA-associated protein 4
MGFPDNALQIFDVESRQSPTWSKHFSDSILKQAHEPILGVTFDPAATEDPEFSYGPSYALFWGSSWMCKLKLDDSTSSNTSLKKRRWANKQPSAPTDRVEVSFGDQSQNFTMVTHFRPILAVDFLSPRELVVVERPLVDVLMNLPPAYYKHKYGAS